MDKPVTEIAGKYDAGTRTDGRTAAPAKKQVSESQSVGLTSYTALVVKCKGKLESARIQLRRERPRIS